MASAQSDDRSEALGLGAPEERIAYAPSTVEETYTELSILAQAIVRSARTGAVLERRIIYYAGKSLSEMLTADSLRDVPALMTKALAESQSQRPALREITNSIRSAKADALPSFPAELDQVYEQLRAVVARGMGPGAHEFDGLRQRLRELQSAEAERIQARASQDRGFSAADLAAARDRIKRLLRRDAGSS